jgi:hypothetical protein
MKKIIASAGVAAIGVASLQAAYAPGLSPQEKSKPWTVGLSLRGFYDDNYLTSAAEPDSFGIEVSPSIGVNLALDQTLIGFSYVYSMRYYEDRDNNSADHYHRIDFKVNHAFSERYKLNLSDRFISAQEPTVIDPEGVITSPLRNDGKNIHNLARLGFDAEVTTTIGVGLSYDNSFYDYDETGAGSRSAILDRMEHLPSLTARWQATQSTVGSLTYQYQIVDHTSSDSLDETPGAPYQDPGQRDLRSHNIFVGVDQTFTSVLNGSVRLGAQFLDYPDAPAGSDDSDISPYADASLTWTYNPGSYLQLGVRHQINQTDIAYQIGTLQTPTLSQESTAVYGVVNHRITPKLTGSLLGHFQHSTFIGGNADGESDLIFLAGVNLTYQINAFLNAEAGYNFDRLDSDLGDRSYSRNRVYIGLRAAY